MSATILAALIGLLYSTIWFKYLRYRFYRKFSENAMFYEILLCKLCAGFWAGVLGFITYSFLFDVKSVIEFVFADFNFLDLWSVEFLAKTAVQSIALLGTFNIVLSTKVGKLISTYGNKNKSFALSLLVVLLVVLFPNCLTALIFFGLFNSGLTFMIFKG
jgi:hypothetical protein